MDPELPILEFANARFHAGRNTTVRSGSRWHGVPLARLRLDEGSLSPPVALSTELRAFRDLDAAALRDEHDAGCRTPEGLLAELQRHYPGFDGTGMVTLCHFELPGGDPG
jgi:hypothetical protein